MAKIPRLNAGDRPSGATQGAVPGMAGAVAPFDAAGKLADVGLDIATADEKAIAARERDIFQQKQAIVNEIDAGRMSGDFEASIYSQAEKLKTELADSPDAAPDKLQELARAEADRYLKSAPNSNVGLELAQRTNARIDTAVREMRAWAITRQTQKSKGDLEAQKNQLAVKAGRYGSVEQVDKLLAESYAELYPQFEKVYGASASTEWHETGKRIAQGFVLVQGETAPVYTREALKNPTGALEKYLTPTERASLLERTERAAAHRFETAQYDILSRRGKETAEVVDLLNRGRLPAQTIIAFKEKNDNEIKAMRLNESFTPEERTKQVKLLEEQGEVLEAADAIRMMGVKYDPVKASINDASALKEASAALKKYKTKEEQLPMMVEQMKRLTLARKSGELTPQGYSAAFDLVSLAYQKAIRDEGKNDGFWIFQDSQEAANREMNRLLETSAVNAPKEAKNAAWVTYMSRYVEAVKKGDVTKDQAKRLARIAIAYETGVDVRIKGD